MYLYLRVRKKRLEVVTRQIGHRFELDVVSSPRQRATSTT
jgi:hypothetical protein